MNRIATATGLALMALLALSGAALGQDGLEGITDDPTSAMLASVLGIAAVVTLLVNVFARPALPPASFDVWAPAISCAIGVALAIAGAIQRGDVQYVDAVLVGLFGGLASQQANTLVTRTARAITGRTE